MIQTWDQTTFWQRVVIFGLTMLAFVMGLQAWVWDSLDHSILQLNQDIVQLTQKNQKSTKRVAALHNVEQEVVSLREKLAPHFTPRPKSVEPNAFRRNVVNIAKRKNVVVHVWNPQQTFVNAQEAAPSFDVVVSVEGGFHDTVQFIHDVLNLSWVQTVNPMKLTRKQDESDDSSIVKTDLTIKGFVPKEIQQIDDLLKT